MYDLSLVESNCLKVKLSLGVISCNIQVISSR